MKPEIFLQAAKKIRRRDKKMPNHCCTAIADVSRSSILDPNEELRFFKDYFKPEDVPEFAIFRSYWNDFERKNNLIFGDAVLLNGRFITIKP